MNKANSTAEKSVGGSRRRFLQWGTGILTFICGLIVGVPLIGSFIGPAFRTMKAGWIKVADMGTLPVGQPVDLKAPQMLTDAYVRESVIRHFWAIKHGPTDVTVFSPICTHLGCHFNWNPASEHFECPCHGSVYAIDGTVLGGPAPRHLDTLPAKIEGGQLYVEWIQYKSGTPAKIPV
ncbi:MAG TPA: ubiquinol-cytochrome c reductase iron-sulfur subunit [Syntrophales bacterium]|nr:ubiquinol-cytochrome c reductase iron-sulfur subunit [Syntrophales bacterium]